MLSETIYDHLQDLYKIKVSSLMTPASTIKSSSTVSQAIDKITKTGVYDLFCEENGSILTTNVRTLLAGKDIADMRIGPFLSTVKPLTVNHTLQDVANVMSHHRARSVPIIEKKEFVGIVQAKKILELLSKKDNKWITANIIFTPNPVTVSSDDSLGTARKLMVSKRFDHLPVVHKGVVKQVLTSFHVLETLNPHEGVGRRSIGVEKIRNLEYKIGNIGSTRISQCTPSDNLNNILGEMLKTDTTCSLVILWDKLHGIVTYRDILSLLAMKFESEVPLFIVGVPEDQANVDLITSKFSNALKRIQKVYSEIQEARVTVKKGRSGGKRGGMYEVSVRVITPHHPSYYYTEVGWDLSKVMETLSNKLQRNLSKRSKRRYKTSIRKIVR